MPKLGIITFHTSHNEGAVLQSLALTTHLSRLLPEWRVEVVDLYYASKQNWYISRQNQRGEAIERFAREQLPLSPRQYVLDGHDEQALRHIAGEYQALVYGSDEIWKLYYQRSPFGLWSRQNNPLCPPFPNAYWPYHESTVPKIAYAISIGGTLAARIPGRHRAVMRQMMHSLSLIGVRDVESQRFVEWLDPAVRSAITKVPDPTFAVSLVSDAQREATRRKLTDWGVDFARPTVAVLARDKIVDPLLRHCRARGYQTVALTLPQADVDLDFHAKPLNPVEWMAALGLFSYCVSERMHACISCLLAGVPVVALDYLRGSVTLGTKLQDLFADFGLSPFRHTVNVQPAEELLQAFEHAVEGGWPREQVQETVQAFRGRSLDFGRKVSEVVQAAPASKVTA